MSKNLIVLFIIILLIVVGFGIYSYDRANQAKKEVEEKNIKLESNNELISELKENIQEKEKQIDELKASLPGEEKDLEKEYTNKLSILTEEKTKLEALLTEKEETIKTIERQKEESEQIVLSKDELISELKENIQEKEKQIDELKASLPGEEKDLEKEYTNKLSILTEEKTKLEALLIEKENIQKNVDAYEIMIEKLKNEKIELEQKLAEEESKPIYYYVTKEDSLWKIAKRFYNQGEKWVRIFEANMEKIKNPDLIYPYQRFTIPKE